jgi:ribosomal peptide maturation radical SAM protein 1
MTGRRGDSAPGRSPHLALVAMPWPNFDMPSPALGALAAVVRRDASGWEVEARHAFIDVWAELDVLYELVAGDDRIGELLYAVHLYPERADAVREQFAAWAAEDSSRAEHLSHPDAAFEAILEHTGRHARALAARLAGRHGVVGLTTSHCQLFPSLVLARELRRLDGDAVIVLGGMGVPYHIGPSVLRQYPFVDAIVQGEGEQRLLALLEAVAGGGPAELGAEGILWRRPVTETPPAVDAVHLRPLRGEVADLDALPVPDYADYEAQAAPHRIVWSIPLEASRGCWWDRVKRTGVPTDTCYFCSLNTSSYRQKSVGRVAREVAELSERHGRLSFRFLDNIMRASGVEELCGELAGLQKDLRFFYELRAQMQPREILSLWEAGCESVQIGIEGLSSDYLARIGKGTSTIQNLQAMKTCFELGIHSGSNLLIGFPGATAAEVSESAECVRRFAQAYEPLVVVPFSLYINNAVFRLPERFGVERIRNADVFAQALPEAVYEALNLYWLDFDLREEPVDWGPVRAAVAEWQALHRRLAQEGGVEWFRGRKPLVYRDGGRFVEIADRRSGLDVYRFREEARELYLECLEIRSLRQLAARFEGRMTPAELKERLGAFVTADLMFAERGSYLALAVADRPDRAAARIRRGAVGAGVVR